MSSLFDYEGEPIVTYVRVRRLVLPYTEAMLERLKYRRAHRPPYPAEDPIGLDGQPVPIPYDLWDEVDEGWDQAEMQIE